MDTVKLRHCKVVGTAFKCLHGVLLAFPSHLNYESAAILN